MLNVEEGAAHVDSKSKILQKSSVLQIQNARFTPCVLLKQREICVQRETCVLPTPKRDTRVLSVSERDSRVSGCKHETQVLRQTQPMPEARVPTSKREIRILPALKCDSHVFNSKHDDRVSIQCEVRV